MTEMSEEQLIELWDMFTEHVPKTAKEDLATQYVKWCQDNGVDDDTLYDLGAEDPYIGEAVETFLGKQDKYEDEDWEDDPYSDDDDDEWD